MAYVTFNFTVTAPTVPNTYNFQWQMVKNDNIWFWRIARMYATLPDGSRHELRRDDIRHDPSENLGGTYYAVDGSGLWYETVTDRLWMPNGSRFENYTSGRIQGNPPTKFIDRNGNHMTFNGTSGPWSDTLERSLSVPIPGEAPTAGDYPYTLPSGVTYTMRWRNLEDALTTPESLHYPGDAPSANCTLGGPQPNTLFSTLDAQHKIFKGILFNPVVLWQIGLPNNTNYTFTYNVYGEINKIAYPTGGSEAFSYGAIEPLGGQLDDGTYSQANRGIDSRVVSDGITTPQVWQYNFNTVLETGGVDPATSPRSVRAPNGTKTVTWYYKSRGTNIKYGFDDARTGMTREVHVYNSLGTMLRRKLMHWTMDGPQPQASGYSTATRNARVTKTVEIILDTGGDALAAATEMVYDADLNVTSIKRYGYKAISQTTGQTADIPLIANGPLLRTEETDSLTDDADYRVRNLLALPTATRLKDGDDNIVAQSAISYDEVYDEVAYPMPPYSSVTQWTDPGTSARGNATTTSRWLNFDGSTFSTFPAGTYLFTHTQYDQCGSVRKVWDARDTSLTNPTLVEYSSTSKFAYPTLSTSPDPDGSGQLTALTTSTEYDLSTGLVTANERRERSEHYI